MAKVVSSCISARPCCILQRVMGLVHIAWRPQVYAELGGGGRLPVAAPVVHQLRQVMRVAHQSLTQWCCSAGPAS